jgi:hypothetical protein
MILVAMVGFGFFKRCGLKGYLPSPQSLVFADQQQVSVKAQIIRVVPSCIPII